MKLGFGTYKALTTTAIGLGTFGIGYILANKYSEQCFNAVNDNVSAPLLGTEPIIAQNMNATLNGLSVHVSKISLFAKEQLSDYWLDFIKNLPSNSAWFCEKGIWAATALGGLLTFLTVGHVETLYLSLSKSKNTLFTQNPDVDNDEENKNNTTSVNEMVVSQHSQRGYDTFEPKTLSHKKLGNF